MTLQVGQQIDGGQLVVASVDPTQIQITFPSQRDETNQPLTITLTPEQTVAATKALLGV